jgi:hypothetical protein
LAAFCASIFKYTVKPDASGSHNLADASDADEPDRPRNGYALGGEQIDELLALVAERYNGSSELDERDPWIDELGDPGVSLLIGEVTPLRQFECIGAVAGRSACLVVLPRLRAPNIAE